LESNKYYIFWVCVCSLSFPECDAHAPYYSVICGLSDYTITFYTLTHKRCNFRDKIYWTQNIFWFSLQILSKIFLIQERIPRDIIINVHRSSCEVALNLFWISWNLHFVYRFSKNPLISNFMNIPPVKSELFHAHRWTDGQT
jgi:hypothetical protein